MKILRLLLLGALLLAACLLSGAEKKVYKVDPAICIGCGLCVQNCPVKAIVLIDGKALIDPEKCIACGLCAKNCPVKAIAPTTWTPPTAENSGEQPPAPQETVANPPVEQPAPAPQETAATAAAEQTDSVISSEPVPMWRPGQEPAAPPAAPAPVKKFAFEIEKRECAGCRECVPRCPVKAISYINGKAIIDPAICIACGICRQVCPFDAPKKRQVEVPQPQ